MLVILPTKQNMNKEALNCYCCKPLKQVRKWIFKSSIPVQQEPVIQWILTKLSFQIHMYHPIFWALHYALDRVDLKILERQKSPWHFSRDNQDGSFAL